MIYRELGRTGERVSAIGLGGYHIGKLQNPNDSIRLVRAAVDRDITFMDNYWDYKGGRPGLVIRTAELAWATETLTLCLLRSQHRAVEDNLTFNWFLKELPYVLPGHCATLSSGWRVQSPY